MTERRYRVIKVDKPNTEETSVIKETQLIKRSLWLTGSTLLTPVVTSPLPHSTHHDDFPPSIYVVLLIRCQ